MAQRSTLLARLDKEKDELSARIKHAELRVKTLQAEYDSLNSAISALRRDVKKAVGSVAEMPHRKTGTV